MAQKKSQIKTALEEALKQARAVQSDLETERLRVRRKYQQENGEDVSDEDWLPQRLFARMMHVENNIALLVRELRNFERLSGLTNLDDSDIRQFVKDESERILPHLSNEQLLAECARRGFLQLDDDESEGLTQ